MNPNINSYEKKGDHTMKNPIKNYFQKIYNETGKKPFTFLNCFLLIFLPIIALIGGAFMVDTNESLGYIIMILGVVVGWGVNLALLISKFQGKGIGLFFLSLLASLLFFCTFILWPAIKRGIHGGNAIWQANMGNITESVNSSRKMGAVSANPKKSAFNWFEYDGYVWIDEKDAEPELLKNYEADEGSYSYDQNQQARSMGYANAKDAEMHGQKIN